MSLHNAAASFLSLDVTRFYDGEPEMIVTLYEFATSFGQFNCSVSNESSTN